jgi:hypothetical protein
MHNSFVEQSGVHGEAMSKENEEAKQNVQQQGFPRGHPP